MVVEQTLKIEVGGLKEKGKKKAHLRDKNILLNNKSFQVHISSCAYIKKKNKKHSHDRR